MASAEEIRQSFTNLVEIIAKLRSPEGCPWDRKQTHTSLRKYLLEESYEVLDAIDGADMDQLCEELGDLLLQILLHAQIAAEEGDFEIADVLEGLAAKMVHRHPHVFAGEKVKDAAEVALNWAALKRKEHEQEDTAMLSGVSRHMPALAYAQNIQRRVAQVGFDWKDAGEVMDKLAEELAELQQADSRERKEEEFGDLLFTLVNISRHLGIDSEEALRGANRRFYRRFAHMEQLCRQRGLSLHTLSFAEQNALWEEAKLRENTA